MRVRHGYAPLAKHQCALDRSAVHLDSYSCGVLFRGTMLATGTGSLGKGVAMRRTPTSIVALLPFCSLVACSSPAPPYADLSSRDALGADPSVLAALSLAEQTAIAEHLEQERTTEVDADSVALSGPATPQEVLRAMDESRRAAGEDALVVAKLEATGGALGVRALGGTGNEGSAAAPLPPLEGEPATETAEAETRALDGKAGQILADVMGETGAHRLVRVTQWPTGVAVVDGVAYVNGSWLVGDVRARAAGRRQAASRRARRSLSAARDPDAVDAPGEPLRDVPHAGVVRRRRDDPLRHVPRGWRLRRERHAEGLLQRPERVRIPDRRRRKLPERRGAVPAGAHQHRHRRSVCRGGWLHAAAHEQRHGGRLARGGRLPRQRHVRPVPQLVPLRTERADRRGRLHDRHRRAGPGLPRAVRGVRLGVSGARRRMQERQVLGPRRSVVQLVQRLHDVLVVLLGHADGQGNRLRERRNGPEPEPGRQLERERQHRQHEQHRQWKQQREREQHQQRKRREQHQQRRREQQRREQQRHQHRREQQRYGWKQRGRQQRRGRRMHGRRQQRGRRLVVRGVLRGRMQRVLRRKLVGREQLVVVRRGELRVSGVRRRQWELVGGRRRREQLQLQCETATAKASPAEPPVSLLWMALPVLYLGRTARRIGRRS